MNCGCTNASKCHSFTGAAQVEVAEGGIVREETDFSPDIVLNLIPKLDWAALRLVASEVGSPALWQCCGVVSMYL